MFVEKEINIYVGLTEMQRKWYRSVLEKDIDAVNGRSLVTGSLSLTYFECRSHWQKGGQDTPYEHGHAGEEPNEYSPMISLRFFSSFERSPAIHIFSMELCVLVFCVLY